MGEFNNVLSSVHAIYSVAYDIPKAIYAAEYLHRSFSEWIGSGRAIDLACRHVSNQSLYCTGLYR
ncbi:hypothetical protein [Sporosarcina obsidiansis]|uniref:hypothetical protein n=1 Tax=Sporosarcina obsidiansis TaxID=2660748 RepID=UPI00129AD524|nr:hypothetical protein [Sporosarcina obsidiansis]